MAPSLSIGSERAYPGLHLPGARYYTERVTKIYIQTVVHFTLYSRSYCHLCDDMLEALQALSSEYPFTVELIDIDADESLVAQFDELVPVLFGQRSGADSVRLCHYFLDEAKTRDFLANS